MNWPVYLLVLFGGSVVMATINTGLGVPSLPIWKGVIQSVCYMVWGHLLWVMTQSVGK